MLVFLHFGVKKSKSLSRERKNGPPWLFSCLVGPLVFWSFEAGKKKVSAGSEFFPIYTYDGWKPRVTNHLLEIAFSYHLELAARHV